VSRAGTLQALSPEVDERVIDTAPRTAEVRDSFEALIGETRRGCVSRIAEPEMSAIAAQVKRHGLDGGACAQLVTSVTASAASQQAIVDLKSRLCGSPRDDSRSFERYLLVQAALRSLDRLDVLPVTRRAKELVCDEFRYLAAPDDRSIARFTAGQPAFAELCKLATLRRFPAGQFDWDVSGISRSDLLGIAPASLPRALWFVARKMRGLSPVFFSHLSPRRKNRSLSEQESNRSYYLMARAMELQPDIRGFAGCSWFRSPDVQKVSPHLAWISKVFLENGALVVQGGAADPDCGVLHRSGSRKRLYEQGRFKPTVGIVMWPRDAMIDWANRHPEYE